MTGRQTLFFLKSLFFSSSANNARKHEETKNKIINGGHLALVVYFVARMTDNDMLSDRRRATIHYITNSKNKK
jgi:hypothetical protein